MWISTKLTKLNFILISSCSELNPASALCYQSLRSVKIIVNVCLLQSSASHLQSATLIYSN